MNPWGLGASPDLAGIRKGKEKGTEPNDSPVTAPKPIRIPRVIRAALWEWLVFEHGGVIGYVEPTEQDKGRL